MGERIVQLPRDVQPLFVGAAPRGLLASTFGFVCPLLGLPERLSGGAGGDEPGDLEGAPGLRERLARVVQTRNQGSEGREASTTTLAATVTMRCPARMAAYTAKRNATAATSNPAAWYPTAHSPVTARTATGARRPAASARPPTTNST